MARCLLLALAALTAELSNAVRLVVPLVVVNSDSSEGSGEGAASAVQVLGALQSGLGGTGTRPVAWSPGAAERESDEEEEALSEKLGALLGVLSSRPERPRPAATGGRLTHSCPACFVYQALKTITSPAARPEWGPRDSRADSGEASGPLSRSASPPGALTPGSLPPGALAGGARSGEGQNVVRVCLDYSGRRSSPDNQPNGYSPFAPPAPPPPVPAGR